MRFLSQTQAPLPSLTVTRKTRTMRVHPRTNVVTLREVTTTIELSLPSIFGGLRDIYRKFTDCLAAMLLPRVYAY